jgi:hypothetical protein
MDTDVRLGTVETDEDVTRFGEMLNVEVGNEGEFDSGAGTCEEKSGR